MNRRVKARLQNLNNQWRTSVINHLREHFGVELPKGLTTHHLIDIVSAMMALSSDHLLILESWEDKLEMLQDFNNDECKGLLRDAAEHYGWDFDVDEPQRSIEDLAFHPQVKFLDVVSISDWLECAKERVRMKHGDSKPDHVKRLFSELLKNEGTLQ